MNFQFFKLDRAMDYLSLVEIVFCCVCRKFLYEMYPKREPVKVDKIFETKF